MPLQEDLKIISVTGAHSGVGKTTLCSIILENLSGFGAIKFTKTSLYTKVTEDPKLILQNNKDTAILSKSGAEKVIWIQSPSNALDSALNISLGRMTNLAGVVVEGNSPALVLDPHLVAFVIGQDGNMKSSSLEIAKRADIFVVNAEKKGDCPISLSRLMKTNAVKFWINLSEKSGEIDKFIDYIKEYIK